MLTVFRMLVCRGSEVLQPVCVQVHSAEQPSAEAEPGAEGGAGDEPLPESQPNPAAVPAGRGGAPRKRER